jgi:CheY-like chemotaxis protein
MVESPNPEELNVSDNDAAIPPSKVLIVDDNLQNLELLEAYLEDIENVTTLRAIDGEECLAKVREENPDLILLDIMMPRMSGYEVCRKLRTDEATRNVPIIMITALQESADIELGMDVGANDFLTKPVNRVDLIGRVRSFLMIRREGD